MIKKRLMLGTVAFFLAADAGRIPVSADQLSNETQKESAVAVEMFDGAENYAVAVAGEGSFANLREGAGTEYPVVARLADHGVCHIRGQEGNWYFVESGEAKGYMRADLLVTGEAAWMEVHARGEKNMPCAELLDDREKLVTYACQFVGNPYVWGGTSLTDGVDCSGFTQQIYASQGIFLPHSSELQSQYGTQVAVSDAQPGDLIFYADNSRIYHVIIYIGNGQAVHAGSTKTGIHISDVSYEKAVCAVSLL